MEQSTSVFIAGGGPVGLSLALALAHFGVDSVVAERKPGTTEEPQANSLIHRSMELFRQLGLERALQERAAAADRGFSIFGLFESLAGPEWGRVPPMTEPVASPVSPFSADQGVLEDELARAARDCDRIQLLFSTEYVDFSQEDDGVTVRCRAAGGGETRVWRARYLVGADGAGSVVRKQAGIGKDGPAAIEAVWTEYWRADFSRHPQIRRQGGLIFSPDPAVPYMSAVGMLPDGLRRSRFYNLVEATDTRRPWDDAGAVAAIRRQVGVEDLEVELCGHRVWSIGNQVAQQYRIGRVLVAGDAAHRMPASGGFGLNTGIQDVHNLAWKLAYVLHGLAAERLLDTYATERRPIAKANGDWSVANLSRTAAPTPGSGVSAMVAAVQSGNPDRIAFVLEDLREWTHSIGRSLGTVYEEGAVIADGTATPPFNSRTYTPTDRPGSRYPHQWTDLNRTHSTLDWFDTNFTLITGPLGTDWHHAATKAADHLGLTINRHTLPTVDRHDGLLMGNTGAVLVRPDGHVAWRRGWLDPDPTSELTHALTTLLRREQM
jgi:putative polyketide hydroxylase